MSRFDKVLYMVVFVGGFTGMGMLVLKAFGVLT